MPRNPEEIPQDPSEDVDSVPFPDNPTSEDIYQAIEKERQNIAWCNEYLAKAKEVINDATAAPESKETALQSHAKLLHMLGEAEERLEYYESLRLPPEKLN